MDIKELHRSGASQRQIARLTGHSRNTIRQVLAGRGPKVFSTPARASGLDPYKAHVKKQYEQYRLSSVRLLGEIRPLGYSGSIDVLRRYVRTLAQAQHASVRATVRYETPPGAQAQADWASCGRLPDGRSVYAFVMVLGYSRMDFIEFTTSMSLPALLRCHMSAFDYFGGIPKAILYDNMKQVRLDPFRLNPQLVDFAGHYGFTVKTHQPYRPRTKGKVERLVDYVKDNFLAGRAFADLSDLNAQARHWLDHTANMRLHGTTGRRPVDLLGDERSALTPVRSIAPYQICEQLERKVDAEGFVHAFGSRYSVPPSHIERQVRVCAYEQKIVVRQLQTGGGREGLIIAEHARAAASGQCIADKEHIAQLWKATVTRSQPDSDDFAPLARWRAEGWDAPVEAAPLSRYEEVAAP